MLAVAALAQEAVQLSPGEAVVAAPCAVELSAPCWDEAVPLTRFAAGEGVPLDPVAADVRLAHADGKWLVRVQGLPEGFVAEVSLAAPRDQLLTDVAAARVGAGVAVVEVAPPVAAGQIRIARVALRDPGAPDRAARWAAAEGPGFAWRGLDVLFVAEPPPPHAIEVVRGDGFTASAAGASRVTVAHDRPPMELGMRKLEGEPYAVRGADAVTATPPLSGRYEVRAIWGPADAPTDLVEARFTAEVRAPAAFTAAGIAPAPRVLETKGKPFVLRDGAALSVADPSYDAAATLLAEELARFTGIAVTVTSEPPRKGDLWVGPQGGAPRGAQFPADPLPAEGFALSIDPGLAAVAAPDKRGAVYGALALADAIGDDGSAPGLRAADWPDLPIRFLYHRIDGGHVPHDVAGYQAFLRRVVARGRYNLLFLNLRASVIWPSHPDIPTRVAWTAADLSAVIEAARGLGIEVVPAMDGPAHLPWVLGAHPELAEDERDDLVCTRHPGLRPLMGDLYGDALTTFDSPRYVHAGFDEVHWATERRWRAEERCPRCAGSPRWLLLAEHLDWVVRWLSERGARTVVWSDMLRPGWNGSIEGTWRALDALDPDLRDDLVIASWTPVGDTVALADAGWEVWWGMTGVYDANRYGLHAAVGGIGGAGLALFHPTPMSAFSPFRTESNLAPYHWSGVLLDGIGLWRTDWSDVPATTLAAITGSAWHPGALHLPAGTREALPVTGQPAPAWAPAVVLPAKADVEGVPFDLAVTTGDQAHPVRIEVGGTARAVSIVAAAAPSRNAEDLLSRATAVARVQNAVIARLVVAYADGTTATRDLLYGVDLWRPDGDPLVRHLWGASGSLFASSGDGPPIDRTLFRVDWINDRPDAAISDVRLETSLDEVLLIVAGATATR